MKKILYGPNGLLIVLDTEEVFPEDPGNGTPEVVCKGNASSTYTCATNEGTLLGHGPTYEEVPLSDHDLRWLHAQGPVMDAFFTEHGLDV